MKEKLNIRWQMFIAWLVPRWRRYQLTRWLIVVGMTIFLVISVLGTFEAKTTDVGELKARLQQSTEIYDRHGDKAGALAGQKGTYVRYQAIAPAAVQAVIATEDRNFYREHGFSLTGTLRGGLITVTNRILGRSGSAGGSTITQQLVKNAFLTQDQTVSRKIREIFLAIQVEKEYSKQDIITMYLNNAYFGRGVWGIEDAAQKYYGVNASQLSTEQAAMLAGMLQSPNGYDPISHPKAAKNRRDTVLQNMVNNDTLEQNTANRLASQSLTASEHAIDNSSYHYPYYFDAVINEALNRYDLKEASLLNDGYKIYTSLDQADQEHLQADYANPNLDPLAGTAQAASVVMDAKTGGVRAVVGGRGEHVFRGFNRATQMRRSPGSTIKPIVDYAPALSRGFSYDSELKNEPTSFGTNHYRPQNALGVVTEPVPMYVAVENSYNIPAVWLLNQMGVSVGYQVAQNADLPVAKSDKNLSLAIGGMKKGVSPLQMTRAYTSFANDGLMSDDHFITKIVDASGKTVVEHKNKQQRLWSKKVADEMTAMMLGVYTHGTGVAAKPAGYQVAGKTGTTEVSGQATTATNATDSWAIAYTPDVVVTTWVGNDQTNAENTIPISLRETGAPLMKATLEQVIPNTPQTAFKVQSIREKLGAQTAQDSSSKGVDRSVNQIGDQLKRGANQVVEDAKRGAQKAWSALQGLLG